MSKYDGLSIQELRSLVDDRLWDMQGKAEQVVHKYNLSNFAEVYAAIKALREYVDIAEEAIEALEDKEQEEEIKEYENHH